MTKKTGHRFRMLDDAAAIEYAFTVNHHNMSENKSIFMDVFVSGVQTRLLVDSGATVNVISKKLWEFMKTNKVKCVSQKSSKELYAYGRKPLSVIGTFLADFGLEDSRRINTEFYVIEEEGPGILGKDSASQLGLLMLQIPHVNINSTDKRAHLKNKFPTCFTGIGKLKDFSLKIPIDSDVTPVIQPFRRIAYHLREKLEHKLDELVSQDIIEKVD
ncbi:uncharacterized protein LOC134235087 [Saccostrea cucullata]|uniref:uncharacterized protein LOC134235087 n=1 Tax=Saccostrea cuccullata TaxID=36930 RepID=UPI002ECFE819